MTVTVDADAVLVTLQSDEMKHHVAFSLQQTGCVSSRYTAVRLPVYAATALLHIPCCHTTPTLQAGQVGQM